jgi:hypothetical protein
MRTTVPFLFLLPLVFTACNLDEAQNARQAWIISPADDVDRRYCIDLTETGGTALDTLRTTGETLEILEDTGFGGAVCKIGDVGWPVSNCFGGFGPDYASWVYFVFDSATGTWKAPGLTEPDPNVPSSLDRFEVKDGDLLALVFTTYDASYNPVRQPPSVRFDEVCTP